MRILTSSLLALLLAGCAATGGKAPSDIVVLSIIGTNDVHGELVAHGDRGGITTFSGYVAALRAARADDGAVLLVDAGDMWQGTLESNLTEGEPVVRAYNELGYAAAAVGNHEFDFGPVGPDAIPVDSDDDPRGALRRRATETAFPLLAANIVDEATGRLVDWDNVQPSIMIERSGIKIGLVGVVTEKALATTIAANTVGLRIDPLAGAIIREAKALRDAGADLVVVLAHAGGRCTEFDDPTDLSSCSPDAEIMRVARAIPAELVDHIVAGHHHNGVAHVVNGIGVTSSYSNTRAFSRVDFTLDKETGKVLARKIYPPQANVQTARYEGQPFVPMASIVEIAAEARDVAEKLKAQELGVYVETPLTSRKGPEYALGNLFVDAVREFTGATIAIHNVRGGIRAELPAGELTYGSVFRMFPFDNRIAVVEMSGADLRRIVAKQVHNVGRRAGFSGMRIFVDCTNDIMSIRLVLPDSTEIADSDSVDVVVNDFLLMGGDGVLTPAEPEGGFAIPYDTMLVRDALVEWFRKRGGQLRTEDFLDTQNLRWNLPEPLPPSCAF